MEVDGEMRKVLLQAPKNGFFYVLDRSNGKLLRAHPYATVTWATHVDMETGRPVENPDLDYLEQAKWVLPGPLGAHNWQAMSVDVASGLVYIPAMDHGFLYSMNDEWKETGIYRRREGGWNFGIEIGGIARDILANLADAPADKGYLKAFDPLTGDEKWVVELPHFWNGGVVATAGGLVFQGDASGYFNAYDKDTGEVLWQYNTFVSILAAPVTFSHEGVQYVSITTGTGGGDLFSGEGLNADLTVSNFTGNTARLLVFKLGGAEKLEAPTFVDRSIPVQQDLVSDESILASGETHYYENCATCHGLFARSGGGMPDLRRMAEATHDIFGKIVLEGIYASNGMASFSDKLSPEDAQNIHAFVRARAEEDRLVAAGEKEAATLSWKP
jgi:quinohemoprotein ethanol dehydrogenase